MENDDFLKEINIVEKENFEPKNVFKFDYSEQKFDNNLEYQKWSSAMLKKYGPYAKKFKCLKDKIYFYTSYDDCRSEPSYKGECPICKRQICYFCSNSNFNERDIVICCLSRRISKLLFYDGLRYIKKLNKYEIDIPNLSDHYLFLISFIPLFNLGFFIIKIFEFLYFGQSTNNSKKNNSGRLESYIEQFKRRNYHIFFILISNLISFVLCIPCIIYSIYFIIVIILVSIPFKFLPFKYYSGIFFQDNY